MIKALSKLNSISSLLLRDNEQTKSRVRELPSEIRGIVQTEVPYTSHTENLQEIANYINKYQLFYFTYRITYPCDNKSVFTGYDMLS